VHGGAAQESRGQAGGEKKLVGSFKKQTPSHLGLEMRVQMQLMGVSKVNGERGFSSEDLSTSAALWRMEAKTIFSFLSFISVSIFSFLLQKHEGLFLLVLLEASLEGVGRRNPPGRAGLKGLPCWRKTFSSL